MKALDAKLLQKFIKSAGRRLKGEWLLIGGTVLPAVGIDIRTTVDIDIVGLGAAEAAQNLELMTVAEELGLPVETVNQAGAFFVRKTGYRPDELILLHRGASASIYRPSLGLYWKLKVARLSESDLEDCRHYLRFCTKQKDKIDKKSLMKFLKARAAGKSNTPEYHDRLRALIQLIEGP